MSIDKAWVLRYASVEEEDRFGGSVTLVAREPITGFKNGQLVRVVGKPVDGQTRLTRPAYQVKSISLVGTTVSELSH